jgi:hypothetical protein
LPGILSQLTRPNRTNTTTSIDPDGMTGGFNQTDDP